MYWMVYVNVKPEGKFLYTETIKLYCNHPCLLYVTWYDLPPTWLYEAVLLISSLEKLVVDVSLLAVFCRFRSTRMWSRQPPLYVWTVISLLPSSSECVSFVLRLVYQVRATYLVGLVVRRRCRTAFIMTSIPVKINQLGVVGRWVGGLLWILCI